MSFLETTSFDETEPTTTLTRRITVDAVFDNSNNDSASWHESPLVVSLSSNCNQFVPNCDDESGHKPTTPHSANEFRPARSNASSRNNCSPPPSSLHTLIGLISESDSVLLNDDTSKNSDPPGTC